MGRLSKVGVVGAGNMGAGIAQKCAQEGLEVILVDIDQDAVQRGIDGIAGLLKQGVERKVLSDQKAKETLGRLHGTTDLSWLKDCQLIIEAVFEDFEVKRRLFRDLDSRVGREVILATNTSSYSVGELAMEVSQPERFVGLHFFYHPAKNRLLEIIPGKKTSDETLSICREFAAIIGKDDITVADAPGFAVNRFFVPWLNEATRVLEDRVANIPTIEEAAKKTFGIGMGPFELMNVTGIPITMHSTQTLASELGDFYAPSETLKTQYASKKPWPMNGEVDEAKLGLVADRLMAVVFYVCCQILDEEVSNVADIDMGAKVGLRWRYGPFELMNRQGNEKVADLIKTLVKNHRFLKTPESLKKRLNFGNGWPVSYVALTVRGPVAWISFQRPEAMNALNESVVEQLGMAFDKAEALKNVRAIVLHGKGKAFVAGADIGFFIKKIKAKSVGNIVEFATRAQEVFNRIERSTKWVICLMDGLALGGGAELAMACHTIVATPKASFGFPETGIGIYPGLGGTQRSLRCLGLPLAKYLVMTGRVLNAEEAHKLGVVEYLVPQGEAEIKILELLECDHLVKAQAKTRELNGEWAEIEGLFSDPRKIGEMLSGKAPEESGAVGDKVVKTLRYKAPLALSWTNEIMEKGATLPLLDGLRLELDGLEAVFQSADALEGLSSLVERRRPAYKGQ